MIWAPVLFLLVKLGSVSTTWAATAVAFVGKELVFFPRERTFTGFSGSLRTLTWLWSYLLMWDSLSLLRSSVARATSMSAKSRGFLSSLWLDTERQSSESEEIPDYSEDSLSILLLPSCLISWGTIFIFFWVCLLFLVVDSALFTCKKVFPLEIVL